MGEALFEVAERCSRLSFGFRESLCFEEVVLGDSLLIDATVGNACIEVESTRPESLCFYRIIDGNGGWVFPFVEQRCGFLKIGLLSP